MIIIWGFRAIGKKLSEGEFFCPKCGADRPYVLRLMRRWFTLFWIPLFPTGKEYGEQVKCGSCETSFTPAVLGVPTSSALSAHMRDATRVAVVAALGAGDPHDAATRSVAVAAVRAGGWEQYDDGALDADLAQVDVSRVAELVAPLAVGLNEHGRESFVARIAGVAVAGGPVSPGQADLLRTVGAGLGLSPAHLDGVVAAAGAPSGALRASDAAESISASAVGSAAQPPPAWYPDPAGVSVERYWDGAAWTDHVRG